MTHPSHGPYRCYSVIRNATNRRYLEAGGWCIYFRLQTLKTTRMEIISIEVRAFRAMMERFKAFTRKIEELCDSAGDKRLSNWLDGQDVCLILNISKRTLQAYRTNGALPFTRIENKMFYRSADVEKVIRRSDLETRKSK